MRRPIVDARGGLSRVKRFRPSPSLAVASVALIVSLAGVAYATIPGGDGVIHSCYANDTGAIRVIDQDQGQACDPNTETALDFNQTGPQGPAGPGAQYFKGSVGLGQSRDIVYVAGVTLNVACDSSTGKVFVTFETDSHHYDASGWVSKGGNGSPATTISDENVTGALQNSSSHQLDESVIVNPDVNTAFVQFNLHAVYQPQGSGPCAIEGTAIQSTDPNAGAAKTSAASRSAARSADTHGGRRGDGRGRRRK